MAQLLPSSPSISTVYSPVMQSSTHSNMGRPVPQPISCPAPNFIPFSAHCRAPHARKSSPCSLRSACHWDAAVPGSQRAQPLT